jgi:hypothetical protein
MRRVATVLDLAEPHAPLVPGDVFGSPTARAVADRQRALFAMLPPDQVLHAIAPLFHRLAFRPGESLLEVGPGSQGGIGLTAALLGLHVVLVERDNVCAPRDEDVARSPFQELVTALEPFARLVRAAGGSIKVVPGDFANAGVQAAAFANARMTHVICTDAINASGSDAEAGRQFTTGDDTRTRAMLAGLAAASHHARTVYTSIAGAHCSDENAARAVAYCRQLEQQFRLAGRRARHLAAICPGSGSVCRAHIYQLT